MKLVLQPSPCLLRAFIALTLTTPLYAQFEDPGQLAAEEINVDYMRRQIKIIASDKMEGREAGTRGNDRAAAHVRKEFKAAGLKSLVKDGSFFQKWDLVSSRDASGAKVSWKRSSKKGSFKGGGTRKRDRHFVVFPFSGSGKARGKVVFAGYGITAPEHDYDDYEQLDVKGKIVLALRGEPRLKRDNGWEPGGTTRHAEHRSKYANAIAHGAAGFMMVTDPVNYSKNRRTPQPFRGRRGTSAPPAKGELKGIPAVWMSYDAISKMLGSAKKLHEWQKSIDKTLKPASSLQNKLFTTITVPKAERKSTQNVVGILEGSDPKLKDEFIVLGAHYDHVGINTRGGGDKINNGADDNGSGTVTLMSIARALGRSKVKPRRSICILAFSGEEKGLLGSEYYVDFPLRPLSQTVAMLNMDMVGRNFDNGCEIIGTQFCPQLRDALSIMGKRDGLELVFKPGSKGNILERSDQAPFYKKQIPIAFFTTGLHSDYHKPSDHWDKINCKNMAKIGRLIVKATMSLADDDQKPTFVRP